MPRELWLQLDNTGKENKNETMRAICSWLCATFKFERVTVFFLIKGHTHVIIDQIFGVITTHIKHMEILVPSVLQEQIDAVLAKVKNQSYQAKPTRFQHCLFDFKKLVADLGGSIPLHGLCNRKGYSDGLGDFKGLHEFVFLPSAMSMGTVPSLTIERAASLTGGRRRRAKVLLCSRKLHLLLLRSIFHRCIPSSIGSSTMRIASV